MSLIFKIPVFPRHLLILIVSVVFQFFFFNYLDISRYFHIYFFFFFILTLPVKIKRVLLLLICAGYGVLLDWILATGGLLTMTTTLIGYIRPSIIRLFFVRDERYSHTIPSSYDMGVVGFVVYSFIVVFIAGLFMLLLSRLSFDFFFRSLFEAFVSSILTVVIIFFIQIYLLDRKSK